MKSSLISRIVQIIIFNQLTTGHILKILQEKPPIPKYGYNINQNKIDVAERIATWTEDDESYIWEHSGLYEGDIMTYGNKPDERNGVLDTSLRWPNGTVPYYIDADFSNEEARIILEAMQEYHNRTCIRFRPYTKNDSDWIHIKGGNTGCWSSVGMHEEGQVVNLQKKGCVRHGVVVHELLHALGFYHQQSATDRDNFVKIVWPNIIDGRQHNFKKYKNNTVTNFGVAYDYGSVMHYSAKAFSKNDEPTIEALEKNVTLGQRRGLSDRDIEKLQLMYKEICTAGNGGDGNSLENTFLAILEWFANLFSF